jgi:hypothetical protein
VIAVGRSGAALSAAHPARRGTHCPARPWREGCQDCCVYTADLLDAVRPYIARGPTGRGRERSALPGCSGMLRGDILGRLLGASFGRRRRAPNCLIVLFQVAAYDMGRDSGWTFCASGHLVLAVVLAWSAQPARAVARPRTRRSKLRSMEAGCPNEFSSVTKPCRAARSARVASMASSPSRR